MRFKTVDGAVVTVGKIVDPPGLGVPISSAFVIVHDDGRALTLHVQTNCLRMVLQPVDDAADKWLKMLEDQDPFKSRMDLQTEQVIDGVVFRQPVLRVVDRKDKDSEEK